MPPHKPLDPKDDPLVVAAAGALRELLRTPAGRTWIAFQLRELCGAFENPYVPGGAEGARHTDFNSGRHFVGMETLRLSGVRLDYFREFEGKHGRETSGDGQAGGGNRGQGQEAGGRGSSGSRRRRRQEEA